MPSKFLSVTIDWDPRLPIEHAGGLTNKKHKTMASHFTEGEAEEGAAATIAKEDD
jgi:hypothetical protein